MTYLRRCADCDPYGSGPFAACNKTNCRFRRMKIAFAKSSEMNELAQAYYRIEIDHGHQAPQEQQATAPDPAAAPAPG